MTSLSYRTFKLTLEQPIVVIVLVVWLQSYLCSGQVVSGSVKTTNGEVLIGVNVMVKGTTRGTVTDVDGTYKLGDLQGDDILHFSSVGYQSQEIKVGSRTILEIRMSADATLLNEVVVVGYGTQRKINLTGAVGVAKGAVFENRPITNIAEGLQGVIPNLNIMVPSSDPADDRVDFNIRGYESINGGEPLILVDGIPMDLNRINPNDIESISVLKDAAAAAIYGGRAAFGVILVQTKSGSSEKINLTASAEFAWAKPILLRDPLNDPHQHLLAMNQAIHRNTGSNWWDQDYLEGTQRWVEDPSERNAWGVYKGELRYYGADNYYDALMADFAPQQRYNFDVSGSAEKASYYVSFGYLNKDGYLKNDDWNQKFKRYNALMKGEFSITHWLSLDSRLLFSSEKSDKPHPYQDSGINRILRSSTLDAITFPDLPFYVAPGDREQFEPYIGMYIGATNPFPYLEYGGRDKWTRNDLLLSQGITLRPTNGLNIRGEFSYNPRFFNGEEVQSKVYMVTSNDLLSNNLVTSGNSEDDWIRNWSDQEQYFVINAYADYTLEPKSGHYLKGMIGFNQEWGIYQHVSAQASNLITPATPNLNTTVGHQQTSAGKEEVALRGYFFRINYSYKDRYLFETNGRYDGTSRFPKDDRWAFFPSFSLGWRLSNESFMHNTSAWLNNLKLRASYGELGNQLLYSINFPELWHRDLAAMGQLGAQYRYANPVYYPYVPSMAVGTSPYMLSAGQGAPFVSAANLVSPSLTWETVSTLNFGLDFTLWNKLDVSFDYYTRDTRDMLMHVTYPQILGADAAEENAADLQTKGWEIAATWRNRVNSDWNYQVTLAFSDNISEITRYDNPTGSLDEYYVGHIIGERWGFETAGLFQTAAQVAEAADQTTLANYNWRPGDIQYADLNWDGLINYGDNTLDDPGDQKIIAYESPRYNFGITGSAGWKNISLSVFFQGTLKYDYWPPVYSNRSFYPFRLNYVEPFYLTDSWSPENPDTYYSAPHHVGNGTSPNFLPQSRFVQDASYVRLKNLTLAYQLPTTISGKVGLENLQLYFSGENLWEYTKARYPLDPETRPISSHQNFKQRVYSIGIKVSL